MEFSSDAEGGVLVRAGGAGGSGHATQEPEEYLLSEVRAGENEPDVGPATWALIAQIVSLRQLQRELRGEAVEDEEADEEDEASHVRHNALGSRGGWRYGD